MDTSNWQTININEIFDISYGNKLDMCQMTPNEDGIPFVTRTATNNGVGGIVEPIDGVVPYPAESLSIALGGSIGSTFLQTKDFYTSQNVAVLQPKTKLSNDVLLFLSVPLVLGSIISFIIFLAYPIIIAKRIKNEERVLERELKGYSEYKKKVKYKIIPFVW